MRKLKFVFPSISKLSVYLLLVLFSGYMLNACKKENSKQEKQKLTVSGTNKFGMVNDTALTKYPGPCPYTCDDPRCVGWAEPSPDCPPPVTTPDTIAIKRNSNNPNEVVGQTHNNGLRSIMPYYNNGTLQPTQQNVFNYTKSFLIRSGYDSATIVNTYNSMSQSGYYRFPRVPSIDSIAIMLYNDRRIGSIAKNYITRLSTLIKSLDGFATPTSTIYLNFANQVITYENQIKSDATITSNEKNSLLSAHSIARFSASYWMNYFNSQSSGTTTSQTMQAQRTSGWFDYKSSLGDDVAGAFAGAIVGGLTGAAVGGVGAGPGAVAGGCVGGIGASAQNAAKQIWDHFF